MELAGTCPNLSAIATNRFTTNVIDNGDMASPFMLLEGKSLSKLERLPKPCLMPLLRIRPPR